MYNGNANRHKITVAGQTFWVDSNLEERVIVWLVANGFHDRWLRPKRGLSVNGSNYTPDLELSIEQPKGSYRALVEIKPTVAHFTGDDYMIGRLLGIRRHYDTEFLLLYADKEKMWYKINPSTGALTVFNGLIPGKLPIKKLYQPLALPALPIYRHRYKRRADIGKKLLLVLVTMLEAAVSTAFRPAKRPKRRYYRSKR